MAAALAAALPSADAPAADQAAQPADAPQQPAVGDRIMGLRQPWLDLILDGRKTLEIRGRNARPGFVWLGDRDRVHGLVFIAAGSVLTTEEFASRQREHMWPPGHVPDYAQIWGLELRWPQRLPEPVPYWCPRTAVGWHIYRRSETDLPPRQPPFGLPARKRPRAAADLEPLEDAAPCAEPLAAEAATSAP